ncbi:hypothetical protein DENIS_1527 [Desulfonema ishimotonii]|uniref:Uncharacterized protein n=1 Tax=Desulfonema ishimotonii TaxID=45657 RepID=A0A401FUD9_9BACT|nr:hypothetical protein [Desulfonema ishimotonii]GBC60570.1 hypothetical protein DENIS_1527 [Desulfonema ishimotonii]
MIEYSEQELEYFCKVIGRDVIITMKYVDDEKKKVRTVPKMESCDSPANCGVKDVNGGYEWSKCPMWGKTVREMQEE